MTKEELDKKIKSLEDSIAMAKIGISSKLPIQSIHGILVFAVKDFLGLVEVEKMEVTTGSQPAEKK